MKKVYSAANLIDASIIKARLEEAGIEAVVQGEHLGPLAGRGSANAYPEIWVRDDADLECVATILAEFEQIRAAPTLPESASEDEATSPAIVPEPPAPIQLSRRKALVAAILGIAGIFAIALLLPPRKHVALQTAVIVGDIQTVREYLDAGSNVDSRDKDGASLLYLAALHQQPEIATLLISRGAAVNGTGPGGGTPLHNAAWKGYAEIASLLLNAGADKNAVIEAGFAPMHLAAQEGHLAVIDLLVKSGRNVSARTNDGATPLHIAAYYGHSGVIGYLIDKGADVNAKGKRMLTALHYAADRGHLPAAAVLIRRGARIDAPAENGCTPLHGAVNVGNKEMVELLLASNANINAIGASITETNISNKTPLDIAIEKDDVEMIDLLKSRGGRSEMSP